MYNYYISKEGDDMNLLMYWKSIHIILLTRLG